MKISKRIAALLLSVVILGFLTLTAFATDVASKYSLENIKALNEANAAMYARSFLDTVSDDSALQSSDVITFYSENDNISGYCVDIVKDGAPYGYVIVKFSNNEPVVSEYALGAGVENPYIIALENADTTTISGYSYPWYSSYSFQLSAL